MPYNDFTLESAEARFGIITIPGDLFPGLAPLAVPDWLRDLLARGKAIAALVSEKARSEFLVTPSCSPAAIWSRAICPSIPGNGSMSMPTSA
jgi:hypothetical protein